MTVQDYLLKFRKMYRAADHRRAELVSGGRLFDVGQVPQSVWRYVQ
ncbi:hypothetical protein JM280_000226 [Salmonella enterica subsp. enterica serovar Kentucky]|nr:hypothetical protein [Salmonella enterica subsp. enterica serovar Kentucky]